jgi:hypothetical protein
MNTSIPVIKGCPPRTGPWPERAKFACACCEIKHEIFVEVRVNPRDPKERRELLADARQRSHLAMRAVAAIGWILVKDRRGRADWICPACIDVALDPRDSDVRAAQKQRVDLAEVDYSVEIGVRS